MRKFLIISALITIPFANIVAQTTPFTDFCSPLNIPLYLSGNYGELRSGHFHGGIDIKTMGEIGKPVSAVMGGYISRIKVQTGGYGKSIYITHPNGLTTVYGHLDHYADTIQQYVIENQYSKHSFEADLYPPKNKFTIKKGQIVAYSGNTGSSGGPHLHFEVRKTDGELPQNVLKYNLPIIDTQKPGFKSLFVYQLSGPVTIGNTEEKRTEYNLVKTNTSEYILTVPLLCKIGFVGFATEVYDFLDGSTNKCGIYKLSLTIDDTLRSSFTIDNISFADTRYVNAHLDYGLKAETGRGVHRLFRLPNDRLLIYNRKVNGNGVFQILDYSIHQALVKAEDVNGNSTVLRFSFKGVEIEAKSPENKIEGNLVNWEKGNNFQFDNLDIFIPSGALYRSIYFKFSQSSGGVGSWSDTFNIHTNHEPIQNKYTLQLALTNISEPVGAKLLFVKLDDNDKIVPCGGEWANGRLTCFTREFGKYFVQIDTVSPIIRPINFIRNAKYTRGQQISFEIIDDLSGLKTYNAYVNNKWILTEFDSKMNLGTINLDDQHLEAGKLQVLKIYAMDDKDNIAIFESQFNY